MTKDHEHMEDLNDQMLVRRKKMNELREKNIDPFRKRYERTHYSTDLIEEGGELSKEDLQEKEITANISGRIMAKSGTGKASFAYLIVIAAMCKIYVRLLTDSLEKLLVF